MSALETMPRILQNFLSVDIPEKHIEKRTNALRLILCERKDHLRKIYSFNKYLLSTYHVPNMLMCMWVDGGQEINN